MGPSPRGGGAVICDPAIGGPLPDGSASVARIGFAASTATTALSPSGRASYSANACSQYVATSRKWRAAVGGNVNSLASAAMRHRPQRLSPPRSSFQRSKYAQNRTRSSLHVGSNSSNCEKGQNRTIALAYTLQLPCPGDPLRTLNSARSLPSLQTPSIAAPARDAIKMSEKRGERR